MTSTDLIGFDQQPEWGPDDMVQVSIALFEAMHVKMAELAIIEEAFDEAFDTGKTGWEKIEELVTKRGVMLNA